MNSDSIAVTPRTVSQQKKKKQKKVDTPKISLLELGSHNSPKKSEWNFSCHQGTEIVNSAA